MTHRCATWSLLAVLLLAPLTATESAAQDSLSVGSQDDRDGTNVIGVVGDMLVSHIQHLMREKGVTDFREAVERGARERLIPILMTAMAAGLALIPLALGGGKAGNEIQTPMAIVILCGLVRSTLLNMVVVSALYLRYGQPSAPAHR